MDFITYSVLFIISCMFEIVNSNISEYNYEKMHRYGLGRRIIPNYRRLNPNVDFGYGEHPATLPQPSTIYVRGPYQNIFQGKRNKGEDYRAFLQKFDYSPEKEAGQRYHCEARLNCLISHLAVRTVGGVPILLRGGVGYRHFYVVARAYKGKELNGSVAVYCMRDKSKNRRYQYGLLDKEGEFLY